MQPPTTKTNGLAIAGFVLAFLFSIVGFILSLVALGQINRSKGTQSGRGLAIAGIVISSIMFVLAMLAAIAIPAFLGYMHKSKASTVRLDLHHLSRSAKAYFIERSEFPEGDAPLTPAEPCCEQPGQRCATTTEFQSPMWKDLDFDTYGRSSFQFGFHSTKTHFEGIATGDPSCDGHPVTYKVILDAPNGYPIERIEEPLD